MVDTVASSTTPHVYLSAKEDLSRSSRSMDSFDICFQEQISYFEKATTPGSQKISTARPKSARIRQQPKPDLLITSLPSTPISHHRLFHSRKKLNTEANNSNASMVISQKNTRPCSAPNRPATSDDKSIASNPMVNVYDQPQSQSNTARPVTARLHSKNCTSQALASLISNTSRSAYTYPTSHSRPDHCDASDIDSSPTRSVASVGLLGKSLPPPNPTTAHKRYTSVYPCSSKILAQKWDEAARKKHADKIKSMKSCVDNAPSKRMAHLDVPSKKLLNKQETLKKIEKENLMLLERMRRMFSTPSSYTLISPRLKQERAHKTKVGQQKRIDIHDQISKENSVLLQRVENKQGFYQVKDYVRDRKQHLQYLVNMTRFPEAYQGALRREHLSVSKPSTANHTKNNCNHHFKHNNASHSSKSAKPHQVKQENLSTSTLDDTTGSYHKNIANPKFQKPESTTLSQHVSSIEQLQNHCHLKSAQSQGDLKSNSVQTNGPVSKSSPELGILKQDDAAFWYDFEDFEDDRLAGTAPLEYQSAPIVGIPFMLHETKPAHGSELSVSVSGESAKESPVLSVQELQLDESAKDHSSLAASFNSLESFN
ncbi:hypothetical protein QVD99_008153 [Batrachochytrium dendrobatidis]|nr:hypothetical protein O5D80_004694 [Batrachochytrium dendrobatidis]KAK5665321.1 hypothetical protein QVD99_008153 [Batrachochytrium dendrobatidis]